MRIQRLELHGFKSFADRTVFEFGPGISCVVGPNGCGKSNVIDAMRWCIGEQSARSLRGGEMQDVIFAGAAERKPVGYAEVGFTLSSEGGEPFPGEYARFTEVQVARRLYRSGASEYLINQTRCRRKDIVDLFMDTGVGNNLYSFIEQGRIDKIVSASAEDRRSLIDEAAGITRYKQRRKEAMSKLASTGGQLDRAADVADEMSRRLKTLERQVVKAARFRRLRSLVRQDEVWLSLVKLDDLEARREALDAELTDVRTKLGVEEAALADHTDALSIREGEVDVASSAVESARDALAELDAQRREVDAARGLHVQRAEELERQVAQATSELSVEEARIAQARQTMADADKDLVAYDRGEDLGLAALESAAATARAAVDDAESGGAALREGLSEARTRAEGAGERRRRVEARVAALEGRSAELPDRLERVRGRIQAAEQERVVLDKRIAVAEGVLEERALRIATLDDAVVRAEESLDEATRKDVHARDAVGAAERGLDAAQATLDAAVDAAETTAGQAEEEVAARVARVQQVEDTAMREADRADDARIAEVERETREQVAGAEARGRSWIAASRKAQEEDLAAWRGAAEAALEADDAARLAAVDAAVRDGEAAVAAAEAEGRRKVAEALAEARSRRDDTEARLAKAREVRGDVDARLAVAVRTLRDLEGRIAGLEAESRAAAAADAGARAVTEALPDAARLVDDLELDEADRTWVLAALDDRVLLPVVTAGDLDAAADAARGAGAARVILPGDGSLQALLGGAAIVSDLDAAVSHHAAGHGAAVVRGTGERVDADGVVHLGVRADQAEASLRARDALAEARSARTSAEAEVAALQQELTAARAAVEGASIQARKAAERCDAVEADARDEVAVHVESVRAEVGAAIEAARAARAAARTAERARFDTALAARVAERDEVLDALSREADALLDAVREEADHQLAEVRTEVSSEREARRDASAARIEAARAHALEEVRATTADVAVRRERCRADVAAAREALDKARRRAAQTAERLQAARSATEEASSARRAEDLVVARVTAERDGAQAQRAGSEDRLEALAAELEGLSTSLADVSERLAESREEAETVVAADVAAHAALQTAREALAAHEAGASEARRHLAEREAALSAARERTASLRAIRDAAARELEGADERRGAVSARISELSGLRDEAARLALEAASSLDSIATRRQDAAAQVDATRARFEQLKSARDEVAAALRTSEHRLESLRRAALDAEGQRRDVSVDLTTTLDRMEERYQLDLHDVLARLHEEGRLVLAASPEAKAGLEVAGRRVEPVDDRVLVPGLLEDEAAVREAVARVEEHRTALQRIGDVHLGALEEYEDLATRFEDLDAQRADLESSVDSIREAIATMNRTCRERFRDAFDEVDAAFREAYPQLVGGGEARLELTDDEDLLETGVDILVRPPGKRMQHLGLMSGGEKAMTAIALLISLFRVKPSPFCVLDEVDAPLDEANGARFNDMLKHMAARTQFIVVTHNRKTMECADTLYGITMPTPGCSALVSVQVD